MRKKVVLKIPKEPGFFVEKFYMTRNLIHLSTVLLTGFVLLCGCHVMVGEQRNKKDTGKETDDPEPIRGYLTQTDSIVIRPIGTTGKTKVSAPPGTVTKLDKKPLEIAVYGVPPQEVGVKSARPTIYGTIAVQDDGSFSGEVTIPDGLVMVLVVDGKAEREIFQNSGSSTLQTVWVADPDKIDLVDIVDESAGDQSGSSPLSVNSELQKVVTYESSIDFEIPDERLCQKFERTAQGDLVCCGNSGGNATITKITAAGSQIWQKTNVSTIACSQLTVDPQDNIIWVSATGIVEKLSPSGALMWSQTLGEFPGLNNSSSAYCRSVAANSFGDLFCVGSTSDSLVAPQTSRRDGFIIKVDPKGNLLWARQFGSGSIGVFDLYAVEVSQAGGVFIAGTGTGNFADPNADGTQDSIAMKMDNLGNEIWRQQIGVSAGIALSSDQAYDLVVDPNENLFLVGIRQTKDNEPTLSQVGMIWRLDSAGKLLWEEKVQPIAEPGWILTLTSATMVNGYLVAAGRHGLLTGDPDQSNFRRGPFVGLFDLKGVQVGENLPHREDTTACMDIEPARAGRVVCSGTGTGSGRHGYLFKWAIGF